MKTVKHIFLFVSLFSFLILSTGCPDALKTKTKTEIIVQAPCAKDKLTIEVTDVTNSGGGSGSHYIVGANVTVKCDGEGISATFYSMCAGVKWEVFKTGNDGKGKISQAVTGDPGGKKIEVKIYDKDDSSKPAHEKSITIPNQ